MLLVGGWLGRMYIKGVRMQSTRQILLIVCKINLLVFVNTVVRWDLDMMLHSDLPLAQQLPSPLEKSQSQSIPGVAFLFHSNDTSESGNFGQNPVLA